MDKVLVVDDDDGLRADLVDYLTVKGFRATGVASAAECRSALEQVPPDVIVLDVRLPDGHGFALAREIQARYGTGCGLVMLTGLSAPCDRVGGLESGADAYLVKHTTLREIEATVRSVLRRLPASELVREAAPATGERPVDSSTRKHAETTGEWQLVRSEWALRTPNGASIALTSTEVAFLGAMLAKPGSTCSRADLIAALDRPSMRFNERNLDEVVRRLRRKVEQGSGMKIPIRVVYGTGYSFTGGTESGPPQIDRNAIAMPDRPEL